MFNELFPASISDVHKNHERRRWLRVARQSSFVPRDGYRDPGEVADSFLWSQDLVRFRFSDSSIVLTPPATAWDAEPLSNLECKMLSRWGAFSDVIRWYDCADTDIERVFAEYWDGDPSGFVVLLSDRALTGYTSKAPAVAV